MRVSLTVPALLAAAAGPVTVRALGDRRSVLVDPFGDPSGATAVPEEPGRVRVATPRP